MTDHNTLEQTLSTEKFGEFWAEVVGVWEYGFMGVDIGHIIVGVLIFAAFLLIRGLFSKYVLHKLHGWASRTDTDVDDKVVDALIPPIRFVPVVLGVFFAGQYLALDEHLALFFGRLLRTLIAYTIFWGLYRVLVPLSRLIRGLEKLLTPLMVQWMFRVMRVVVVVVGGAVILEIWGIAVAPLLAGLGLFGAAVALGAQDLFKNLIGGLTIIAEKRFQPGEWIKVDGVVEGTVEDIGFRSTKIRRFDKAPVHVPNSQLSDAAVTNFTRMTHRRIKWTIGVVYGTNVDQLKIIRDEIMKYIKENGAFASPDEVSTFVRVDSFGASSIDFLVYCFTKTTVWGEWLEIKEAFAHEIKDIVENRAGTSFAFPSTSLYVEQWPDDTPEMFVPPGEKKRA
ncbi:MAG: mechanosensitive ion channel family protein [Alphaproteobacteria bacterium]|nr:mechanosensitive ion channel family protein [Alphaproteobacteria bacterium]